jgi:hypothetical protein
MIIGERLAEALYQLEGISRQSDSTTLPPFGPSNVTKQSRIICSSPAYLHACLYSTTSCVKLLGENRVTPH